MAACSEEVTSSRTDDNRRNVTFSVIDGGAISVETQNSSTRINIAPWTTENNAQTINEKVVKVETDLPISEPLCLTITEEPITSPIQTNVYTRGSLLNSGDASALVFGVTEFLKDDVNTPFLSNIVPIYQNTTLDDGSELFRANETWEHNAYDGTEYDFYAYAPKVDGTEHGMTLSNNNTTITYNAAGVDVGDQPDLMTAKKATSAYVSAVPLTFQHRLCAIQIKTSGTWAAGFRVSAVKFTNVISSGTFNIDTNKDDAWTSKGPVGDYVVSGFNEANATGISVTGPDDKWLMMVPQTLSNAPSSKLSITLTDASSNSYIVIAPISATTWTAGQKVTYNIAPESFATMTVNYPSWNDGGNAVAGPVSTYETADQFGLFVLDKDGKILISNQLVTPTTGDAATSRTLDIPATIFKSKQYKYFLMYPYRSDLETLVGTTNYDSYYKKDATGRTTDADAFFADVISNWAPAGDQSTAAVFKNQDLQIASLSGNNFYMAHKMGLVEIELKTDTYYDIVESNGGTSTITKTATNRNATASSSFDNSGSYHVPMQSGSTNLYYAIVSTGDASTQFNSTTGTDQWTSSYTATGLSSGEFAHHDAYSTRVGISTYSGSFSYSGNYLTFTVPFTGTYRIECWGAQGCERTYHVYGRGSYVAGDISLQKDETLYIYVGEQGKTTTGTMTWNGGGYYSGTYSVHGSGGAGTDVRLVSGAWNNFSSLKSRIIVAAGGGADDDGATPTNCCPHGGGVEGINFPYNTSWGLINATQITGGVCFRTTPSTTYYIRGRFGSGNTSGTLTGGGGGYYGGGESDCCGMGGTCYISGHRGCIAVTESATESYDASGASQIAYRTDADAIDRSTHYSGKKFTNTKMIDGAGYPWTDVQGTSYEQMPSSSSINAKYAAGMGHEGHGYCRITGTAVSP